MRSTTIRPAAVLSFLLVAGPALAGPHQGPCTAREVGTKVTVCPLRGAADFTRCIAVAAFENNKASFLLGSCHNPDDPCGDGKCDAAAGETSVTCPIDCGGEGSSACCTNQVGQAYTVATCGECKKGALAIQCVEDSHAAGDKCVPNDCDVSGLNAQALTVHKPGQLEIQPAGQCSAQSGLCCCKYADGVFGIVTSTVDGTPPNACDSCPDQLPGGQLFVQGLENQYSSGDGFSCIPVTVTP